MDEDTIRKRLVEQDADPIPELTQIARLSGYRGGGLFHFYNVRVDGASVPFIAKFPSHEQPPGHRLLAKFYVARLAHLFSATLAAKHAVLEIRPEHVIGLVCQEIVKHGVDGYNQRVVHWSCLHQWIGSAPPLSGIMPMNGD